MDFSIRNKGEGRVSSYIGFPSGTLADEPEAVGVSFAVTSLVN